jgi:transposase
LTSASTVTIERPVKRGQPTKPTQNKKKFGRIDNFTEDFIARTIDNFYKQNISPSVELIYKELTKDGAVFPYSLSYFVHILKNMGFEYKTLDRRQVIMDSPRLINLRDNYLTRMKKYREDGKHIIYLDETWYDTHDVSKKGWQNGNNTCALNVPASRGKRIIILHAGSENGWALMLFAKNVINCSADYHQDMNATVFETWFKGQLLPNIPEGSIIVMDNASYHSRQSHLIPCTQTRKGEIQTFLSENNITYPAKAKKEDLLKILKKHSFPKNYYVDEAAKDKNCEVLRLPPYYCNLNPIELMWSTLKRNVRNENNNPKFSDGVLQIIRTSVDSTNHHWKNCCMHVQNLEKKMARNYSHPAVIIEVGSDNESVSDSSQSDE